MRSKQNGQTLIPALTLAMPAILITTLAPAAPCHAECPPCYEIVALVDGPDCGGGQTASVMPEGLNDEGQFVGRFSCAGGGEQALLWDSGSFIELDLPDGFHQGRCEEINGGGMITGTMWDPFRALYYDGGEMINLGVLPGDLWSAAAAISNTGRVVGYSSDPTVGPQRSFVWEDGAMSEIELPFGPNSCATDISDDGETIVGWMGITPYQGSRAYIRVDGQVTDLGTVLDGPSGWAEAVNNHGTVVGAADVGEEDKTPRAFLWCDGEAINLGALPGFDWSYAFDINDDGVIVGRCRDQYKTSANALLDHAVVWRGGVIWDLNELIPEVP